MICAICRTKFFYRPPEDCDCGACLHSSYVAEMTKNERAELARMRDRWKARKELAD